MFHALNSLLAVGSLLGDNLVLFQNGADDLHIQIIVLCYQNPFSREKKGLFRHSFLSLIRAYRRSLMLKLKLLLFDLGFQQRLRP